MDTPKKVIVGYDLCEDVTQISCYSYKTMEPIPISTKEEEEYCPIPTVLCVKTETKQWLFGEEAIACAASGAGILVDHLLEKIQSGEVVELFGLKFTPVALLEKYLHKTLILIKNYFPTEQITKLVVTVRNTEPELVDIIYEALASLGLEKDRVVVMSHAGAYLYYALSQNKSLWRNDVGLFDFNKQGLYFYQINLNRRSNPMVAGLTKKDYSDTLDMSMLYKTNGQANSLVMNQRNGNCTGSIAYIFENIANTALYKQIITTLYFTGSGFDGGWAEQVIKSLCTGRRVFYGQNLFTKGACYAAKELSGDRVLEDFILLSDDMITSCIAIKVYCDSAFQELPLTRAGENWYEVSKNVEVITQGDPELEIVQNNIMTRDITRNRIPLNQFHVRPDRMTRLLINLTCKDKHTGTITVKDLGFGEFYPSSGMVMETTIELA